VTKFGLASVSLVAAIPAGLLSCLTILAFVTSFDSLIDNPALLSVVSLTLVVSIVVTLLPAGILVFGKKAVEEEEDLDDDIFADDTIIDEDALDDDEEDPFDDDADADDSDEIEVEGLDDDADADDGDEIEVEGLDEDDIFDMEDDDLEL